MQHIDYAYTFGMDDAALEERLETTHTGVLSLSDGSDSYAIPLAHYYDGTALYFRLGLTEHSKKRRFLEATETACYVLYGTDATDDPRELDTWSVVVSGSLRELPATERDRFDTAEINRRFAPIRVFDEEIDEIEIAIYELDVDSATGRETSDA